MPEENTGGVQMSGYSPLCRQCQGSTDEPWHSQIEIIRFVEYPVDLVKRAPKMKASSAVDTTKLCIWVYETVSNNTSPDVN